MEVELGAVGDGGQIEVERPYLLILVRIRGFTRRGSQFDGQAFFPDGAGAEAGWLVDRLGGRERGTGNHHHQRVHDNFLFCLPRAKSSSMKLVPAVPPADRADVLGPARTRD